MMYLTKNINNREQIITLLINHRLESYKCVRLFPGVSYYLKCITSLLNRWIDGSFYSIDEFLNNGSRSQLLFVIHHYYSLFL
jgi:hypothetical protein